ncbi:hypothetical protein [Herbaspirillum aquaticum]|uniref:Uncharacterized protein n=1 Tax=Herbaspirillum aquaticum TaxID=568783 RepID=A0A225SRA2_9BURK|nr:hypothetical protein [Herbaspirillum aquaticum]OWY31735.1 hypothetical protein CEJ45_24290 [Herbaspirillum aquaticum]
MNLHDQSFIFVFVLFSSSIIGGARWLEARAYSRLLTAVIIACLGVMAVFHIFFLSKEGEIPIHFTVLAIAQFGVLGLAFKLWLALNYPNFKRPIRIVIHVISHSSFALIIMIGYWAKTNHPLMVFLLYPLSGLSVSLIGESIEEAIEHRRDTREALNKA